MTQDEAGQRAVFNATNDRYAVQAGLVPVPEGLEVLGRSAGGVFLIGSLGDPKGSETVLAHMRECGLDKTVWDFTLGIFAAATAKTASAKA